MNFCSPVRYLSSSGRNQVTPSADPLEMIEILWTGSHFSQKWPEIAWPTSWWAIISLSSFVILRDLLSGPIETFSTASSRLSWLIVFFLFFTDVIVASFSTFSRSAPENPTVFEAICFMLVLFASFLFFMCTFKICSLA